MQRRGFLDLFAASLLAWPGISRAQPRSKSPVVGVLITESVGNLSLPILVQGLRDLGRVEGQNIVFAVRSAGGSPAVLPERAAELVALNVDVIYAAGPAAIRAAAEATTTIPIVALDLETDPIKAGWAHSLARPGRNVTGLFLDVPSLAAKWLQLLKEAVPTVRHVGLLWDPSTGSAQLDAAKMAAPRFGLELHVVELRTATELEPSVRNAINAGAKAIVMLSTPLVSTGSAKLADLMLKHRLPALSPFRRFAEAGGLMAYGPDFDAFRTRSASYVDMILKGGKAADTPIEQPTKFELVLNLKTAAMLAIAMPRSLLVRADRVIQ